MTASESATLGHEARRELYERVERGGTVPKTEVITGTLDERRALAHHVAILKRDGYLDETEDGELRIALDVGEAEAFSTGEGDVEFAVRPARQDDLSGVVGAIRQVAERGSYIVAESVADELDHEDVLLRHNEIQRRMFFVATVTDGEARRDSERNRAGNSEPNRVDDSHRDRVGDSKRSGDTDPRDEVVGWAHLNAPELDKLAHTAELTVGVVEGYRGRGVGSRLLDRVREWASENGYEKLYQSVPSTNERAIEFFEDRGWEVEAVREDHYEVGDEYVDEVMMALAEF